MVLREKQLLFLTPLLVVLTAQLLQHQQLPLQTERSVCVSPAQASQEQGRTLHRHCLIFKELVAQLPLPQLQQQLEQITQATKQPTLVEISGLLLIILMAQLFQQEQLTLEFCGLTVLIQWFLAPIPQSVCALTHQAMLVLVLARHKRLGLQGLLLR